jgi:hypothetical protein
VTLRAVGERFIERRMVDTCQIYRDKPGFRDDYLDEDTGVLVPPSPDRDLVYNGICMVKPITAKDMSWDEGGVSLQRDALKVMLPKDSPLILVGDWFLVITSQYDPALTDREFRVMKFTFSTHATYRWIRIEDIQQDFNSTNPLN